MYDMITDSIIIVQFIFISNSVIKLVEIFGFLNSECFPIFFIVLFLQEFV